MRYEELKDTKEDLFTLLLSELFQLWCVRVYVRTDTGQVCWAVHTAGCLVSLCLIKRYEHPFKLPPNSRSFTESRPCEFRAKWRKLPCLAATSEATYRSSSRCLKVVQVRPVFEHPTVPAFYGLIESFQEHQAGCPTFFCRYHTDSLISAHTLRLLNFPPHIFDFISNRANPVLSCLLIGFALWTWVWLPSGWRLFLGLQSSIELWWNWADNSVVLFSPPALQSGEAHFLMCDFTQALHNKKCPDPARTAT